MRRRATARAHLHVAWGRAVGRIAEVGATVWARTAINALLVVVVSSLSHASIGILAPIARRSSTVAPQLLALLGTDGCVPRRSRMPRVA